MIYCDIHCLYSSDVEVGFFFLYHHLLVETFTIVFIIHLLLWFSLKEIITDRTPTFRILDCMVFLHSIDFLATNRAGLLIVKQELDDKLSLCPILLLVFFLSFCLITP